MKRKFRLTDTTDFKRVRRIGKSYAHPLIVLVAAVQIEPQPATRLGVVAGRAIGNAVMRNRAKRRLRAALQPLAPILLPGWDVILIARRPLVEAPFAELHTALSALLQRARLLQPPDHERFSPTAHPST